MSIDWRKVKRVLVVRLRSIGDTVLITPSLDALRRFLPAARIDVLLEDWVAPVLENFDAVDEVLTVGKDKKSRLKIVTELRRRKYDVAFNLHGGSTSALFVRASGAKNRVGFAHYRYPFLYNHLLSSSVDFWQRDVIHSAEQHLALLGFVGVPVADRPKTRLVVSGKALISIDARLAEFQISNFKSPIALIHPVAAFDTKQWAAENFARVAEFLRDKGFSVIAIATKNERAVLENLKQISDAPIITFDDLTLPEITALASKSALFVGNDSGIAHIAAAVGTSCVVVFGSSSVNNWRPWTNAPSEIVYEKMVCQPCAGHFCGEFDKPECIRRVSVPRVVEAAEKILNKISETA